MKKVLSLVFVLIFALSAVTVAFAADPAVYQCDYCKAVIEGEAEYNKHLTKTCPVVGSDAQGPVIYHCPYEGCGNPFTDKSEYDKHLTICTKKPKETAAEKVENFFLDFDVEDDMGEVIDKVFEVIGKLNLPNIVITIIDLLEKAVLGIIDAI